jgi:glycosyltransferase involved in cell wall biosynthesis
VPWRLATEVDDLRRFDVGLQPLADDEWTRGKCGYKALQYMSVGIPSVSSPVGVATDMIAHGRSGSLATTEDEWVAALSRLIEDAALRRAMGEAAREDAVARWSVRRWAPVLADALLAR